VRDRHPKDDEAAIFHALQLVAIGYLDPTDKTYAWQKKGGEILNSLLPRHQNHPGIAHYIIHSLDYPATAELGLKAARAYSKIAPDSAHALHMPSHIFTRLGLWEDSVESNLASARAAVAQAKRLRGGGGSFDQLHAMDYLVYAWLQQARDRSARKALQEIEALAQLDDNQFSAAYAFAAAPARWALERHDWKSAAALAVKPAWFPWSKFRNAEALVHYTRAIGSARSGDTAAARKAAEAIAEIKRGLPAGKDYDWSGSIAAQLEAATALILYAEGNRKEGIQLLRTAADHEDAIDKHPVTPGALIPVREMLADLLMETGAAADALREYERVLQTAPRRFNAVAGASRAADRSGDEVKARAYAEQLLAIAKNAEGARPELDGARTYLRRK
jgi:tetratricopeptide (TPR) repeat protein